MKLSNSALDKYKMCPRSYQYRYVEKLVSKFKGSPLYFGSAIDHALNYMLLHKDEKNCLEKSIEIFKTNWLEQQDNEYKKVSLPKNPFIFYSNTDFEPDLLSEEEWSLIGKSEPWLEIDRIRNEKKQKGAWALISEEDRIKYNYAHWLSLNKKGPLMLEAYYKEILPLIKDIISIQVEINLKNDSGDEITGFTDMIARLQDGTVALLDNKTSSVSYKPDSAKTSQQLGLYKIAFDEKFYKGEIDYKIDKVGYLVMRKDLKKITHKVCTKCGNESIKKHNTCDFITNGIRCGGEWTVRLEFQSSTQVIIDSINESTEEEILNTFNVVNTAIQNHEFPMQTKSCFSFGNRCEYWEICQGSGRDSNIIKLSK